MTRNRIAFYFFIKIQESVHTTRLMNSNVFFYFVQNGYLNKQKNNRKKSVNDYSNTKNSKNKKIICSKLTLLKRK